ncbi:MAG: energy-coupling factor transporter transmembrane component T [Eubacterium sp.]|nr:energy-coupling factor transporter transmembrane component T [Eubacterium sp.]
MTEELSVTKELSATEEPSATEKLSVAEELPAWMLTPVPYEPEKDRDGFISKSILKLLSLLGDIRTNATASPKGAGAAVRLLYTLLFIILAACSHNMFFTYCLLAGFLVRSMLLPAKLLQKVIRSAFSVMVFSMILLLPAVFMGSPRTMLTVSLKVFFSVGMITLLSCTTPWNQITAALKVIHIPDLFIFTFDITLKYIAVLGEICYNILTALRMRSVGRNHKKGRALSGVLGVTFLKSQEMADEMYGAMRCRGFEGAYTRQKKGLFLLSRDWPAVVMMAAVTVLFIYLERAI